MGNLAFDIVVIEFMINRPTKDHLGCQGRLYQ